ncbi:Ldh family oxidoreductase [Streptomyces scopuliridis]|uniref:Ldh family oxidoreductase n=1 Tax=Streptomyces scopuliridis TaxID=452529 RepID=UPI0036762ECE
MPLTVGAADLLGFAAATTEVHGVPPEDARLLADTLVTAELWGHPSHGMLRLPWYLDRIESGATASVAAPQVVSDNGAVLVVDGRDGLGQVLTDRAVPHGVERARRHGISAVAVRNSGHFGTAAYFTRKAAEQGCVAILVTNASPAMAPWGGREKRVGTNPWSIAAPGGRYGTVVMDIANTAVARGKIYHAKERGQPIPEGWAADADGVPTTDPRRVIEGLILPMAGHKGYAISFMFDVLAGVLTGSAFGGAVVGPYQPAGKSGVGHLLICVDIRAMADPAEFEQRMEALVEGTKATPAAPGVSEVFVPGEPETTARLIEDDRIAAVTLTGSNRAGAAVGSAAGRAAKKSVLELGGSDAFVVLDDADIEAAAAAAVKARFTNSGQSCVCAKRFIVDASVADAFTSAFVAGVQALRAGDPRERDTQVGPLARDDLRAAIQRQVDESVAAGARLLTGGKPLPGAGYFYQPTVLADTGPGMPAFDEETFGPLAAVAVAHGDEEAVRLANAGAYGLGLSVWTADAGRGIALARRITSGAAFINAVVASDPRLPFGGTKRSGYGRELAAAGVREFTNTRTYWVGT